MQKADDSSGAGGGEESRKDSPKGEAPRGRSRREKEIEFVQSETVVPKSRLTCAPTKGLRKDPAIL